MAINHTPMNIAIIGCGTMGMTYARNLAKMKDVRIAGVCDLDPARAGQAAAITGAVPYTDIDDLVQAEKPDTVCVCLPTDLHKSMVLKLAEKGLHIICEKPVSLTVEDAREMKASCELSGVRLFIGHVVRFFPNYQAAAESVRLGEIGSARMGHFKRFGSFPTGSNNWYRNRARSGGVIMDLMIHDIDFALSVFGDVQSVFARVTTQTREAMEYAQVTLKFANGAIANLTGFWGYPGPFTTEFEIAGDGGIIQFDSSKVQSLDVKISVRAELAGQEGVQVPSSPMEHDPYYHELAHFVTCIREGSEPLVTVDDAIRAVEIVLAAERSASTGNPVELIDLEGAPS